MENSLWRFLTRKLGICAKCMREAFLAMAVTTAATTLVWFSSANPMATIIVGGAAIGLGMLWAAHLVAYAVRASMNSRGISMFDSSRRKFTPAFIKALMAVAVASAMPATFAKAADCFATCKCSNSSGGRYIGVSAGGCNSACADCLAKCGSGCSRDGCTQTDC